MSLSAHSLVGFTQLARTTLETGRGEGLQVLRRIEEAIGSDRAEHLSVVMKAAGIDAMEVASLVRAGLLSSLDLQRSHVCERCHRQPTAGTTLCGPCRHYLGWARLMGQDVPEPPPILRPPAVPDAGSGAMHSRRPRRTDETRTH